MVGGENRRDREVAEGDLIQVNEDGPSHLYRCILVVDAVKDWGVQAYCIVPGAYFARARDEYTQLGWKQFDRVGAKSKFVAIDMPEVAP